MKIRFYLIIALLLFALPVLSQNNAKSVDSLMRLLNNEGSQRSRLLEQLREEYSILQGENRKLRNQINDLQWNIEEAVSRDRLNKEIMLNIMLNDTLREQLLSDKDAVRRMILNEDYFDARINGSTDAMQTRDQLIKNYQQKADSPLKLDFLIKSGNVAYFILAIIILVIGSLVFGKPIYKWLKKLSLGLSDGDSQSGSFDAVSSAKKALSKEGIIMTTEEIKDQKIDVQQLIDFLTRKEKEDIHFKDIFWTVYLQEKKQEKLVEVVERLKKNAITVKLKELIAYSDAGIEVHRIAENLIKAKEKGIDISFSDLAELNKNQVNVTQAVDLLIKANKEQTGITLADLKPIFLKKIDFPRMESIVTHARKEDLRIIARTIEILSFKNAEIDKFVELVIEAKMNSLDQLKATLSTIEQNPNDTINQTEETLEAIAEAYIKEGVQGLENVIEDLNLPDEIDRTELIRTLQTNTTLAFKITLKELRELARAETVDEKLIKAYRKIKEHPDDILIHDLLALNKAKIDPQLFVKEYFRLKHHEVKIDVPELRALAVNKIDMEKYIEVLLDDTNKKLSLPYKSLAKVSPDKIEPVPLLKACIAFKKSGITMTVSELTRLFPGFVNVEKIVQAYIPCYDKRIVSKNDFLALPHAEIDTAKVLQVFEHYFDEYESKKHTIDENLKWSDLHPDEFEITLVDLKESQFKNINIASLVNAFLKLKQEEPSAGYADLKNYKLPLENPEALVDVLIAFKNELLAETGTAPSLKELMAKVVTRQMVDDIRYAHNQLKSLDKPPSLVDLLKHKTSGGNPRKVADTIRANSILDYATAMKIDLKGEIDKALNRAKEPEISDIFPITAFTKDGDRITFKVRLRTLVKINNYLTVNGKVNIEEKVSEALVATVRAVEDYHTLLEQYDKIGKTVADNEIVQNELRHSAYTVQSVTIIDSYSAKAHKQ